MKASTWSQAAIVLVVWQGALWANTRDVWASILVGAIAGGLFFWHEQNVRAES